MKAKQPIKWAFIDHENNPHAINILKKDEFERIILFVGENQKTIRLETLESFQIEIIKIQGVSKNNLDFHLSYYLGNFDHSVPKEVHFIVISSDQGFDNLVNFIHQNGRICNKISLEKEAPEKPSLSTIVAKFSEDWQKKVHHYQKSPLQLTEEETNVLGVLVEREERHLPKNKHKLVKYIEHSTNSNFDAAQSTDILNKLSDKGLVSINPETEKIEYHFSSPKKQN
ncbi:MAG: hypothetical protein ACI86H_000951 [bacterium]|jgi:hypothetical protein